MTMLVLSAQCSSCSAGGYCSVRSIDRPIDRVKLVNGFARAARTRRHYSFDVTDGDHKRDMISGPASKLVSLSTNSELEERISEEHGGSKLQIPLQRFIGGSLAISLILSQAFATVSPEIWTAIWGVPPAEAVLYSPDTKVPRSAEVALRRAIPAVSAPVRKMQESLEDIFYLLRIPQRKPYGSMEGDVKKALKLATDEKDSILAAVPPDKRDKGLDLYSEILNGKGGLEKLFEAITAKDPDKISIRLASSLETIAQLETLQLLYLKLISVPSTNKNSSGQAPGLPFLLPAQYQDFPRLTGRAVVEMVVQKGDGSTFTVAAGGGPQTEGTLQVVLDGYSAPLTSGNFADLIVKGVYNGTKLRSTEQAILSDNEVDSVGRPLPLEILPAGEFQPLYRTTLAVQHASKDIVLSAGGPGSSRNPDKSATVSDIGTEQFKPIFGHDGEIPVLPLSVFGALAMAHNTTAEDFSSPSQFFFYLYDRRSAGLGGLSFDEGQFSVFGYVTKGRELLSQLKTGDIIRSATMISGTDRLVLPSKQLVIQISRF